MRKIAKYFYIWYFFCTFVGEMKNNNTYRYICVLVCACFACALGAQNLSSSPYSRYAYGDLSDNVPGAYRGMGGVGVGMRSNKVINPSQPASYTACDSMTFMFDLAASVMWSHYNDATGKRDRANGNLEYVTLQFPLYKKWVAMSLGVMPYSSSGYDVNYSDSLDSDYHYTTSYIGTGNISEVYGGLSVNICDWAALGLNAYYMFGDLTRARSLVFDESELNATYQIENLHVSSLRLRYGAQLFHTWGDHMVVLGGVFENKMNMNGTYLCVESYSEDTVKGYQKGGFEAPMYYGAGASYTWANRLTVGFDYSRQCMSGARFNGKAGLYRDINRYALGVEYRNNPLGRRYVDRVMWRFGMNVADEYLTTITVPSVRVGVGVGLPLRNSASVINTTLEYQHRGSKGGLEDNNLRLTVNASISETWFFKRKL